METLRTKINRKDKDLIINEVKQSKRHIEPEKKPILKNERLDKGYYKKKNKRSTRKHNRPAKNNKKIINKNHMESTERNDEDEYEFSYTMFVAEENERNERENPDIILDDKNKILNKTNETNDNEIPNSIAIPIAILVVLIGIPLYILGTKQKCICRVTYYYY